MASTTTTTLVDDLTGVSDQTVRNVRFTIDGVDWEIDLTAENRNKLQEVLAPYVAVSRKPNRKARAAKTLQSGPSAFEIRTWAASNGLQVGERGRIPQSLRDQYMVALARAAAA